ncbi:MULTISPECIES: TraR/DksA C4-type zinc finger protein [Acidithiobacillus]|uniref:TraR/DksA C4-type zinc finger protein n=1 Tax=Acidithiobacillus TaxID=119977 RepID=UPI0004E261A1|nr:MULTISPECIES: TraR/DksA C4-type zinc finger protein [Acidithiobacillus]
MEEIDLSENLTDPADIAARNEMAHRISLIKQKQADLTPYEEPDEDDQGNRFCLECADKIPEERLLALPRAVRCVPCAERLEAMQRSFRRGGGFHA